jgi:hypothetical protein
MQHETKELLHPSSFVAGLEGNHFLLFFEGNTARLYGHHLGACGGYPCIASGQCSVAAILALPGVHVAFLRGDFIADSFSGVCEINARP